MHPSYGVGVSARKRGPASRAIRPYPRALATRRSSVVCARRRSQTLAAEILLRWLQGPPPGQPNALRGAGELGNPFYKEGLARVGVRPCSWSRVELDRLAGRPIGDAGAGADRPERVGGRVRQPVDIGGREDLVRRAVAGGIRRERRGREV